MPPTFSHRSAISFINEIFNAKNALEAYFISSALSISVKKLELLLGLMVYKVLLIFSELLLSTPQTTLSGLRKSSIADPSLKNSGFDAIL